MRNISVRTVSSGALLLLAVVGSASAQSSHEAHHAEKPAHPAAHAPEAGHGEPIATSRPALAEYTGVLERGTVQVESGYSLARVAEETSHSIGEVLVRYGVGAHSEVRLGLNSFAISRDHGHQVSGLQDSGVELKSSLLRGHGWVPSAAVVVGTSLPTGSDEFGSSTWEPASSLSLGWHLPKHVSLTTTVAYVHGEDHGVRAGEVTGAGAVGFSLSEHLHAHAEYAVIAPTQHFEEKLHHVSGGFGYHLSHDLQVDVWAGHATHHGEPEYLFGVGLSRRWR